MSDPITSVFTAESAPTQPSIRERTITVGEMVDYINERFADYSDRQRRVPSTSFLYHNLKGRKDALAELAAWAVDSSESNERAQ